MIFNEMKPTKKNKNNKLKHKIFRIETFSYISHSFINTNNYH